MTQHPKDKFIEKGIFAMMPEFKINSYRHMYWIYAILNKMYGSEVKIVRDPLHCQFDANKHNFDLYSHNVSVFDISKFLGRKLRESGYENVSDETHVDCVYRKISQRETGQEILYVHLSLSYANGTNEPYLKIWTKSYWKNK